MQAEDRTVIFTALVGAVLVVVVVALLGGLAMGGMMDGDWGRGGMMGGWGGAGWLMMLVPVIIVVVLVLVLLGAVRPVPEPYRQAIPPLPYPMQPPVPLASPQQAPSRDAAVVVLEERLARGEISEKDYLSVMETLRRGRGV